MSDKKKKKQIVDANKTMAAGWLMTYADLMALLMAFFVMLLAASEVDKAKFEEFGQSMKMALGVPIPDISRTSSELFKPIEQMNAEVQDSLLNPEDMSIIPEIKAKIAATEHDADKIAEVLEKQIKNKQIEVKTHGRIIVVRLLESGIFKSGEAELQESFKPVLSDLRKTLKTIDGDIIISGHADDIPIDNDKYRSNWELSAARAYSVIEELLMGGLLNPERFVLRGFGESRPLVPNNSAANRAKNRRVEILIDQRDPVKTESDMNKVQGIMDLPITDGPIPRNVEKVADDPDEMVQTDLPMMITKPSTT